MQFADFGPKLALNQTRNQDDQETGMDPIEDHKQTHNLMSQAGGECEGNIVNVFLEEKENQDDENDNNSVQLRFTRGEEEGEKDNKNDLTKELKSKKRTRTSKTSVEKMNVHLRVLRSLMPGSYVQRELLQCLELQKRKLGTFPTTMTSSSPITSVANLLNINGNVTELEGGGEGLREETRENKSCLADVEVELLSLMP
ncbi:hypothetical protein Bca52824_001740 [Brassica carinata]|uniref:Uncharacterized protein n=1 Tax=Brassica carinata TaxID=52824 RepID=A0A8X7WJX2_BRACI|nr:hypothetical protein Bca52824_001740 [Brassica carinata]